MTARLGILLSGSGTTYDNLARCVAEGRLDARIAVVVSSRPRTGGLEKAARHGHRAVVARDPADALAAAGCDYVAMCGWMRFWDPPARYRDRVVNIHPALLPAFGGKGMYGHHVHEAVLTHGCRITGCTAHLVRGDYDTGPILAQRAVAVHADDTVDSLGARVQAAERILYPAVIQGLVQGRLRSSGGRCWIDGLDGAQW
jgi:phosphoribosylglycinamide formyltransferase 1